MRSYAAPWLEPDGSGFGFGFTQASMTAWSRVMDGCMMTSNEEKTKYINHFN